MASASALSAANSSGWHEARDGEVLARRPQVLAEREDVDADLAQLAQHGAHLVELFAEAEHEARLRDGAARLRVAQDGVRARVAGLHAHLARQARHRLEVVREDVGAGGEHGVDRARVALEVAHEHLEHHLGRAPLARADRLGPVRGAAVGEVVAVDARDDGVAQAELGQHRRDVLGLAPDRAAAGAPSARRRTGTTACRCRPGS